MFPFQFFIWHGLCPAELEGQVVERVSIDKVRFFRVERTYAVKTGKWYFEFEAVTGGDMRVGWARPGCKPDVELGTDKLAFVFDGYRVSFSIQNPSPSL